MSLDALLAELRQDVSFIRNVTAWRTLVPQLVDTVPWPTSLNREVLNAGQHLGVSGLYAHQAQASEATLQGQNVVLATGTASGKTLAYTLPVLHMLISNPEATALLLFPTKALAHDQIAALQRWDAVLQTPVMVRPYDGDTPQRQRSAIRKEARVLVSNPDMMHLGILPHHTKWMRFFRGLRYVVLDELHTYRGVFGSHIANVLRRLRRICHFYGADPQLIAASATIANPKMLAESLWDASVTVIDQDSAPYGQRHVVFYNPPLLNPTLGLRASASAEAVSIARRCLRAGLQTIFFARSRLTVELLLREIRERAAREGHNPDVVQGYRGGYLPKERRQIERALRSGDARVVVATNALELGIDIGALDVSVLVGYPGSIAATRQQMGRAGRRAEASLSILIATPAPLDQYLVTHPEYFFGRSLEEARVSPNTLSLLASHLACATFELPFQPGESFGRLKDGVPFDADGTDIRAVLDVLCLEGLLHKSQGGTLSKAGSGESGSHAPGFFTWVGEAYPAQSISLRSATPDNVIIQAVEALENSDFVKHNVLGTVDRPSAPQLVHEGAVYFHGGEPYLIQALDWDEGLALAQPMDLDYYTVASATTKVERLTLRRQICSVDEPPPSDVCLTDEVVMVHIKPTAYRRVHLSTHETLGWGEIALPEQVLETEAFRLTLGPSLVDALAQEGVLVAPLDYGPEWEQIRKAVLDRDAHHCRMCGTAAQQGKPLEVHHLTPLRTFLAQYPRPLALRLAHAQDNLLTLCPMCHKQAEQARGARTALSGLAYLLRNLAPVFLMCDAHDLGTAVEARDAETGNPAVIVYDLVPGGVGLTPRLVDLWPQLARVALERVRRCSCASGCPACVGPTGESEPGAKNATRKLLEFEP